MWGPLLVLALLLTINPLRLGIMLVVLARPRPMPNLLVYWIGTLLAGLAFLLGPLIVLHSTPKLASFAEGVVQSDPDPAVKHSVIGFGALLLVAGTLMAVLSVVRAPARAKVKAGTARDDARSTSTLTLDPGTLPLISRLIRPAPDDPPHGASRIRQLLGSTRDAWQNGSPWIAFVIGLMVMPADGVLLALALIVASGAVIATQLGAAIAFLITVLMVEEVILVSNVLVPEKTEAALRRLHDWAVAHHRKFMAAILAVTGISLMVQGMGGL